MTVYRVRTVFTGLEGSPWLNTLFFDAAAGTAQQAATAAGTFWTSVAGRLNTAVLFATEPDVTSINEATLKPIAVTNTTVTSGAGSSANDRLPHQDQGVIRLRTGVFTAGREIRGRIFVPGMTEADTATGRLIAAAVSQFNTNIATLIATANADLVIFSRKNFAFVPVASGACWDKLAVLRSRRD